MNVAVDGDFQSPQHKLTWQDREAMIRAAHRRWAATHRACGGDDGRKARPALDPIDEMDALMGWAE